jgi:SAM-dependent methyltransferase
MVSGQYYEYDNIGQFFNDRYRRGDEVIAEKKLYAIDLLEQQMPPDSSIKILDLGCGTGKITSYLKEKGYDVVGADISSVAIEKLREKGIDGIVHDIKDPLLSEDSQFDVVFATDLLELVPDIYLFLSEVRRVTKNNGLFIFTMPNLSWLPYRIKSLLGKSSSDLMPPSHCRFWISSAVNEFLNNQYYQMVVLGGGGCFAWQDIWGILKD